MLKYNPKQKLALKKVLVYDLKILTNEIISAYKMKTNEISQRQLSFDKKMELLCYLEILFKLIEKLSKSLAFEQKREKKITLSITEAYWMYRILDDADFSNYMNPTALHLQLHNKLTNCI